MVWTEITRAKYCRDGLRYASDTTDEEWAMIAPHMPCKNRRGRPRVTAMRALVNSIFFIAQSGCQWRLLPKEFPPYTTVQRSMSFAVAGFRHRSSRRSPRARPELITRQIW